MNIAKFPKILAAVSAVISDFKNIEMKYNTDLVVNILTRGIPTTTNKIISKGFKND